MTYGTQTQAVVAAFKAQLQEHQMQECNEWLHGKKYAKTEAVCEVLYFALLLLVTFLAMIVF